MKLVALDLGFLYGKAIVDGKPVKLKSVVGTPVKQRFDDMRMGESTDDRIQARLRKTNYFVSDMAIHQSPSVSFSLKGNRFNTDATNVIVDALLAQGLGNGNHDLFIVSGLPVSHYDTYKDAITELFMGGTLPDSQKQHNYDVEVNGEHFRGCYRTVQGKFLPQPFGVLVDNLLDDAGEWRNKALAKKTVAVIDVGFGTSDIYTTNSLDPIEPLTFSTNTAMNHAYSLIAQQIEEKTGVSLKLHQIEPIVLSKSFRTNGKNMNLTNIIEWAYQTTADQLTGEILNKWRDNAWQVEHIIVGGGGGERLYPFLIDSFNNIELTEDSQMAVVRGYNKWGMKLWRDRLVTAVHV